MKSNLIFTWALNERGEMVHIDDVPNGKLCKCICPHCKEELIARHGDKRHHGFAHHSKIRRATLKICYMVILYKLAEHIIASKKQIFAPSYHGIYKERKIIFNDIKIDSRYEREDKQPDVIATTKDNQEYLIEFIFKEKVQHNNESYYNQSCIEIDLTNQTLESLENFLLSSSENRKWINNEIYFNGIEEKYKKANKPIILKSENDCILCKIKQNCCAVKDSNNYGNPILIKNNGNTYRLCKTNNFNELYEKEFKRQQSIQEYNKIKISRNNIPFNQKETSATYNQQELSINERKRLLKIYKQKRIQYSVPKSDNPKEISCFNCKRQDYCFILERYIWSNKTNSTPNLANLCNEYESK